MRAGPALVLVGLLIVPQVLAATPSAMLQPSIEDQIQRVSQEIDNASSTYGDRDEFAKARGEVAKTTNLLKGNATLLAEENLIRASGAVTTGKLRAQAQSSSNPSQEILDEAQRLVQRADARIVQVRSDLASMERTGLEPVAFDGGLLVAHTLIRAMEMSHTYRQALQAWEEGDRTDETEARLITGAAGTLRMSLLAEDLLSQVAQARQEAPIDPFVPSERLSRLADERFNWSEDQVGPAVQRSYARLQAFHESGDHLLTLAAYLLHFQNLAQNGLQVEYQQGKTDPDGTARNLYNQTADPVTAWLDRLAIPGDLATGALASAQAALDLNDRGNLSMDQRANNGALAAGFVHLAEEHVGLLQQGLTNYRYEPGTQLADPGKAIGGSDDLPWAWIAGAAVLGALVVGTVVMVRNRA